MECYSNMYDHDDRNEQIKKKMCLINENECKILFIVRQKVGRNNLQKARIYRRMMGVCNRPMGELAQRKCRLSYIWLGYVGQKASWRS